MTQPPMPPDPAQQSWGPPPGAQPAPYQSPSAHPPQPPSGGKRKTLAILGGVIAVGGVILVKVLIGFGIGRTVHAVEHRADGAEQVVTTALKAATSADLQKQLVAGVEFKDIVDPACVQALQDGKTFKIPKSSNNDDGSADVTVDFGETDTDVHFHLVNQGGWKIDKVTCS